MGTDYLKSLPVTQVAAWYSRLADMFAKRPVKDTVQGKQVDAVPLSAQMLKFYLANRDPAQTFHFDPPNYLRTAPQVMTTLRYHRKVFLSQEKAKVTGGADRLAGLKPRLDGAKGFQKWDGVTPLALTYESLTEIGSGVGDIIRIQMTGSEQEKDLFTALRGFQLHSATTVRGERNGAGTKVSFMNWSSHVLDVYDWNFSEHLTVPNPDFGSKAADAVRPTDQKLTVYHRNAERLEKANLAAPYKVKSAAWYVTDAEIVGEATL